MAKQVQQTFALKLITKKRYPSLTTNIWEWTPLQTLCALFNWGAEFYLPKQRKSEIEQQSFGNKVCPDQIVEFNRLKHATEKE